MMGKTHIKEEKQGKKSKIKDTNLLFNFLFIQGHNYKPYYRIAIFQGKNCKPPNYNF